MKKDKVFLFGHGNMYYRKKEYLFEHYEIVGFLDNSVTAKETDAETGLTIYNPQYVSAITDCPIILLSYSVGSMVKQLMQYGVCTSRFVYGAELPPYNTFENMLFSDGYGKLIIQDGNIYYQNTEENLLIKTEDSGLERIISQLKETPLYPQSGELLNHLGLKPLDDAYGFNRGTPVDRYYIERFLERNEAYVQGTVLEVGDREYTMKYGHGRVTDSIVMHVAHEDGERGIVRGNLETGKGVPENCIDCFICTQTLPFIYDVKTAAENILKCLKPGGVALITVGGITPIISYERRNFGHYWNFTDMSLQRIFENQQDLEDINVVVYGNVKSATAFLYGVGYEEMRQNELDVSDMSYQVIIGAVVRKKK